MRAIITGAYYSLNPLAMHLWGRWENDKRMHYVFDVPFRPYFYYEEDGKIIKKEVDIPSDVPVEKEKHDKTYEADIVFTERVLIDLGIRKGIEIRNPKSRVFYGNCSPCDYKGIRIRKDYIDIETDDNFEINVNKPKGEVLSIAIRDSFTNLTTIHVTIPKSRINTNKLMELLYKENSVIRDILTRRGLGHLAKYVGNLDLQVISHETEAEMLEVYSEHIQSENGPDVNVGYNINGFDLPYLQNRAENKHINLGYRIIGHDDHLNVTHNKITNFDLYKAYMRLQENNNESNSLESVSQRELGIGKIKHTMGYKEMYEKEPEKFLVYNYRDTLLCHLIDMKIGAFDFFLMLSEKAGTLDAGKWNATYLLDTLLLRFTHNTDFRIPSHSDKKKIKVEGGFVAEAMRGRLRNVVVFDYKHLYPRLMRQFNISHETLLVDDQIGPDDVFVGVIDGRKIGFSMKKPGIIPQAVTQLETERYEIKGRMKKYPPESDDYNILNNEQRSVKELDNSFYGMTGSPKARLFEPYIQASITYLGREALNFVMEYIKTHSTDDDFLHLLLCRVIYGDTDSIFIYSDRWANMDPALVIEEATRLNRIVNESLKLFVKQHNGDDNNVVLEMEFEKLYSVWEQFGSQKQYAGYIIWKDGKFLKDRIFDVKGFDPRRSDRSPYTKDFMAKLLRISLESDEKTDIFLHEENEKWENHDIDVNEIGIYFSLKKDEYGNNYEPKRAYRNAIKEGIKLDRMKGNFRLYFLKGEMDVIAVNYDDPLPSKYQKILDWKAQKRRCFTLKVKDIMGDAYLNELEGKPKKMSEFEVDE